MSALPKEQPTAPAAVSEAIVQAERLSKSFDVSPPWLNRVLEGKGMDYWESGMHLALGSDIYESFVRYQQWLIREYDQLAREFGFVSYVAKDYAAAKMFAEFGVTQSAAGPDADEARTLASVLLKAAEYRLKPSDAARDALFAALDARRSLPNFDNISFAATEALVAHDVEKGRWRPAMASTELAARLASAGGPAPRAAPA